MHDHPIGAIRKHPLRGDGSRMSSRRPADPSTAFFEDLGQREREPLLAHKTGTVRVELTNGGGTERWFVGIDDGKVTVSKRNQASDSTLRADKSMFDQIVKGKANAVAALLRGAISVEGDWNLLIVFQRLFPSPPS